MMLLCGVASVALMFVVLRALGAGWGRMALALGFTALAPLLVGPVILSHFDLWPAVLSVAAIAAVVTRHERLGAAAVALGAMAKVYPILILPFLLAYVWRRQGRREAIICAAIAGGVGLAILLPFAALAPSGILDALYRQVARPLQVESLGAAALLASRVIFGLDLTVETSFGSQNLAGALPDALATLSTLVMAASLLGILVWFVRGPSTPERFVQAAVGAVAAYVALGKVLSPQYMAWLIPLVPLVGGRRGLVASAALAAALMLTAAYFPARYFPLVQELDVGAATQVFLRDISLVAVLAAVALPLGRLGMAWRDILAGLRARIAALEIAQHPLQVLFLVLVASFVVRALWITHPGGSLIFDETYYVNAARVILRIPVPEGAPYGDATLGLDPNLEHPPLGKVAIALSMALFGDTAIGWRVPSLIAGLVGLVAMYGIVRAAGETPWLGVLAVSILSLDNLTFVHGRIGTLDMMALAPMMVGAWLGLRGRPALAGVAFAVAVLVKITAIFGLGAFVLAWLIALAYRRWSGTRIRLADLRPVGLAVASFAGVALIGLFVLDQSVSSFNTPFDHIRHMLTYGAALQGGPSPTGIASNPWDWIVNNGRFDYLRVDVSITANDQVIASYPSVRFQGALNPVLLGAAPMVVAFGTWLAVRRRHALAGWGLLWIVANYVPFYFLVLVSHRITYLYYILPAVPGLAALTGVFLARSGLPRIVIWAYLGASVLAFIGLFPYRQIP
jgi:predicted membrane-bound dolichyl-phosphate-mannose-protein mannosyltransferase